MRTVGFIGAYDKIDLILYVAKILTVAKKKVLFIDATINQKAKYVVPSINPTKTYVTEFEGFDVAVGFKNLDEITEYLGIDDESLDYDIVLLDTDNIETITGFNIENNYKNCFVTAFDLYSLKKGIELMNSLPIEINFTKVLFSTDMSKDENLYLEYLAKGSRAKWGREIVNFPIELGNYAVIVENQIISRIRFKGLSEDYIDGLKYLMETVFYEVVPERDVSKIIKNLERES